MIAFFIFLLGIIFGSFANVLIYRTPRDESIVLPGSYCPKCKNKIAIFHNIPIVSFLLLKGKCATCGEKISPTYPMVELLGGVIFLSIYLKSGIGFHFLFVSFAFLLLLSMSVIDLRTKMAPDSLNLLAFCFALSSAFFGSSSFFETPITPFLFFSRVQDAFTMAGFLLFLKFFVEYALKKEALGEADIIVAGTLGALLGFKFAVWALFFAALISLTPSILLRTKGEEQIPFIPFMALGAFIVYCFGKNMDLALRALHA